MGNRVTEAKPKAKISWTEANQAFLVAEFTWLKSLLSAGDKKTATSAKKARVAMKPPACIDRLAELFNLSGFERNVLLLCAGVEMDSELAGLCGEAQGRPPRATFGLAMAILPEPHWSALGGSRSLRRFRGWSKSREGRGSPPQRCASTSACCTIWLASMQSIRDCNPFSSRGSFRTGLPKRIRLSRIRPSRSSTLIPIIRRWCTCGDHNQGQEDAANFAAHRHGLHLFTLHAEDLPAIGPDLNLLATLWERQSRLLRVPFSCDVQRADFLPRPRHLAERLPGPLFIACHDPIRLSRPLMRFDFDRPRPAEQKRLWEKALGVRAAGLNGALDAISEQFRRRQNHFRDRGTESA